MKKLKQFHCAIFLDDGLELDTIIEDVMIPEGTVIKYSVNVNDRITDEWEWELLDFNLICYDSRQGNKKAIQTYFLEKS